jgi:hypothetical protein
MIVSMLSKKNMDSGTQPILTEMDWSRQEGFPESKIYEGQVGGKL